VQMPPSIRFDLFGTLASDCSAKDVMLYILCNFSKQGLTLNRVIEFGGEGLSLLSIDERATLCNMATECGAKTGICEPDQKLIDWLKEKRPNVSEASLWALTSMPDKDCVYEARIDIDLSSIRPMVAHPGDPDRGIPADPMNGEFVANLNEVKIDIAYGGSCTAGKYDDIDMYAKVVKDALSRGLSVPKQVNFYIQYGSLKVNEYSITKGYHDLFLQAGVIVIPPGCGACIGCGPGMSTDKEQVTVSAINRNFQGRSGPGKLYLASPLTVAASAFAGKIIAWSRLL